MANGQGKATEVGGVLAVVHEGDGVAVEIGVADGRIEVAMGVATEDKVDAPRASDELHIVNEVFNLPTEVAEADDDITTLTPTQDGYDTVGLSDGVEITDAFAVFFGNQSLERRADTEDSDTEALATNDGVGTDGILQAGGADIVVTADGGEGGHLEKAEHVVLTEVELVVADGGGVVAHGVHQTYLCLALEEVIIERTLGVVAAVEKEQVGIDMGAEAVDEGCTADIATGVGLGVRLNAAVGVGGLDDEELGGLMADG